MIEVVEATARDEKFWQPAVADFLGTFYMEPERRRAMIAPEPPMTGNAIRDVYLGAVGEHVARRWGPNIPAWTDNRRARCTSLISPAASRS